MGIRTLIGLLFCLEKFLFFLLCSSFSTHISSLFWESSARLCLKLSSLRLNVIDTLHLLLLSFPLSATALHSFPLYNNSTLLSSAIITLHSLSYTTTPHSSPVQPPCRHPASAARGVSTLSWLASGFCTPFLSLRKGSLA